MALAMHQKRKERGGRKIDENRLRRNFDFDFQLSPC